MPWAAQCQGHGTSCTSPGVDTDGKRSSKSAKCQYSWKSKKQRVLRPLNNGFSPVLDLNTSPLVERSMVYGVQVAKYTIKWASGVPARIKGQMFNSIDPSKHPGYYQHVRRPLIVVVSMKEQFRDISVLYNEVSSCNIYRTFLLKSK